MSEQVKVPTKNKLQQFFCRHEYQWFQEPAEFQILSGDPIIEVCIKCSKRGRGEFMKHD